MFSDEEPELRDLIIQNLENCGFLNKIKAELRAGVFLALEEDGNLREKIPLFNKGLDEFVCTSEGKLMVSLVREFLEFFNLNFTLSVFDPEIASSSPLFSRLELCDNLNLQSAKFDGPIISTLLKKVLGNQSKNSEGKSSNIIVPEKHASNINETVTEKISQNTFNRKNVDLNEEKSLQLKIFDTDLISKNSADESEDILKSISNPIEDVLNTDFNKTTTIFPKESNKSPEKDTPSDNIQQPKDSLDPHPFFDVPVPFEKKTFYSFSETSKDKSEGKLLSNFGKDLDENKKSSLSSLRDLPSLNANHSWTFNLDSNSNQNTNVLKSFTSTDKESEKETDLKSKDNLEKRDSESNEESSEKQNSDESIEEDIEEDISTGMDDLLNSSLSLGDDITTDQTVSQVSIVEGIDHVEPCNS